jgi:hypothetical protein
MCHVKLIAHFIFHSVMQMFTIHEHENNTMCFELDYVLQQAKHFFFTFHLMILYVMYDNYINFLNWYINEMKNNINDHTFLLPLDMK